MVHDAETHAIQKTLLWYYKQTDIEITSITIFINNTTAILNLIQDNSQTFKQITWAAYLINDFKSCGVPVTLVYNKVYRGIVDNKTADKLAKKGTEGNIICPLTRTI